MPQRANPAGASPAGASPAAKKSKIDSTPVAAAPPKAAALAKPGDFTSFVAAADALTKELAITKQQLATTKQQLAATQKELAAAQQHLKDKSSTAPETAVMRRLEKLEQALEQAMEQGHDAILVKITSAEESIMERMGGHRGQRGCHS